MTPKQIKNKLEKLYEYLDEIEYVDTDEAEASRETTRQEIKKLKDQLPQW